LCTAGWRGEPRRAGWGWGRLLSKRLPFGGGRAERFGWVSVFVCFCERPSCDVALSACLCSWGLLWFLARASQAQIWELSSSVETGPGRRHDDRCSEAGGPAVRTTAGTATPVAAIAFPGNAFLGNAFLGVFSLVSARPCCFPSRRPDSEIRDDRINASFPDTADHNASDGDLHMPADFSSRRSRHERIKTAALIGRRRTPPMAGFRPWAPIA
jgi:hypothetical protein